MRSTTPRRPVPRPPIPAVLLAAALTAALAPTLSLPASPAAAAEPVRVVGTVTASGTPLPRARVDLLAVTQLARPAEEVSATTRSDRHGAFALQVPEPGPWVVRISSPGHSSYETAIAILTGDVRLHGVDLSVRRTVQVRLRDRSGNPLRGSAIWPATAPTAPLPLWQWRPSTSMATTDAEGSARLALPASRFLAAPRDRVAGAGTHPVAEIQVTADGFGPRRVAVTGDVVVAELLRLPGPEGDAGADPEDRRPPVEPAPLVAGRVVERGSGRPLAGVRVWTEPLLPGGVGRTRNDGSFELSPTGAAPGRLVAAAIGHEAGRVETSPGAPMEILLAALRRGVGQVVDDREEPLGDARVHLRRRTSSSPMATGRTPEGAPRLGPFTTTADGTFEVPDPPSGVYDLEVTASGYAPLTVPGLRIADGGGRQDLGVVTLVAEETLSGRVLNESGEPIPGARVRVLRKSDLPWEAALAMAEVGAEAASETDGSFAIRGLPPAGRVLLRAESDGYVATESRPLGLPRQEPVVLVLTAAAALSGWVVDADGGAVPEALLTAQQGSHSASTWSGDGGDFEIRDLRPGRLHLWVSAAGHRAADLADLEIPDDGGLDGVEVVLQRARHLTGRVLQADGRPAAAVRVEALLPGASDGAEAAPETFTLSDDTGRFELAGLAPRAHVILAVARDGRRARLEVDAGAPGTDEGGSDVLLILEPGVPVAGRVVAADGSPVNGARVSLTDVSPRADGGSFDTASDALGRFAWSEVAPGDYLLRAAAEGLAPSRGLPVTVSREAAERQDLASLELVLDDGVTVRGRVEGVELADLAAVRVRASSGAGSTVVGVDHQGTFVLPHLASGVVALNAELAGSGRRTVERIELPAGAREIDVVLWLP